MITSMLSGGLGNQMFQYAAGRALSLKLNTQLRLDLSSFKLYSGATSRHYELDIFDLNIPKGSSYSKRLLLKLYPYLDKHRSIYKRINVFADKYAIGYNNHFGKITNSNTTLFGYFQNIRYFEDYQEVIREDFQFINDLSETNADILTLIKDSPSVAVHIRRGDYLTNTAAAQNFITCGSSYYQKAIEEISKQVPGAIFFIFGEDFEWIKEHIHFGTFPFYYIDWNQGDESYIDMQLMSLCRHNIIANSTFSWWGAWLNNHADKIVIAPDKWFTDEKKNSLLTGFYPQEWIIID